MIGLELSLKADDRNRVELVQTLENLRRDQVVSGSCIECHVYQDLGLPGGFLWLQWWKSEQGLQNHLASVEFRTLLGAVKVLGSVVSTRVVGLQDSTSIMGALLTDRTSTNKEA